MLTETYTAVFPLMGPVQIFDKGLPKHLYVRQQRS